MTLSQFTNAKSWSTPAPLPKLSDNNWNVVSLLGLLLVVMAICQLVSFNDFKGTLTALGLGNSGAWAVGLIIAEVWAAASFFKVRLAPAFRMVGTLLAILVAGFWFTETLQQIVSATGVTDNTGYFSKYLMQAPGWWTVLESTVLVLWTLNAVHLVKNSK